jgi:hypothetical protein
MDLYHTTSGARMKQEIAQRYSHGDIWPSPKLLPCLLPLRSRRYSLALPSPKRYEGEMSLLERLLYDVGGETTDREDPKAIHDAPWLVVQNMRWSPQWT